MNQKELEKKLLEVSFSQGKTGEEIVRNFWCKPIAKYILENFEPKKEKHE